MNDGYSRENLKDVLKEVSHLWKRKITQTDVVICEDMFLKYDFDTELIKYLLSFSKKRGAETLRYLYPIADILKQNKITDSTKAELTLEESFKKYTDILIYINWSKKSPSKAEKEKIDEILTTYDPTPEEIEEVGKITKNAKKPSLRYFETVLRNKREGKMFYPVKREKKVKYIIPDNMPVRSFNFDTIKKRVREKGELTDIAYNTWISDLMILKESDDQIEITALETNDMFYECLTNRYTEVFRQTFQEIGINKNIIFVKK